MGSNLPFCVRVMYTVHVTVVCKTNLQQSVCRIGGLRNETGAVVLYFHFSIPYFLFPVSSSAVLPPVCTYYIKISIYILVHNYLSERSKSRMGLCPIDTLNLWNFKINNPELDFESYKPKWTKKNRYVEKQLFIKTTTWKKYIYKIPDRW